MATGDEDTIVVKRCTLTLVQGEQSNLHGIEMRKSR
jgi:hypothetical protein